MSDHQYGKYKFKWTNLHLPRERTDPLRYKYDILGSAAEKRLQEMVKTKNIEKPCFPKPDLYTVLKTNHAADTKLSEFWEQLHTVPDWVDWQQLERGQNFFYRYAAANIMGFALQGFVGENSAAAGVVEVLVRTGGFSTRVLFRRLLETFQLILEVTDSINSIKPGGTGHTTCIRVRLLHASVRNRIMKLAKTKPGYFDVEKFGIPVNTLDSIHSIATFCCNHMWLQLPQQGVYPSQQEVADYIALWRYVGFLLATPPKYFSSVTQAKATMESMLLHELHITPKSLIVGLNFVETLKDLPPFNISAQFIEAGSRALNGDAVCDSLGFGRPPLYSYACWTGHCWLVAILAFIQQKVPTVDKAVIAWFHETLHWAVIHSSGGLSGGSKLEFKYVPRLDHITQREKNGRSPLSLLSLQRPVEAVYLFAFLIGNVLVAGGCYSVFSCFNYLRQLYGI